MDAERKVFQSLEVLKFSKAGIFGFFYFTVYAWLRLVKKESCLVQYIVMVVSTPQKSHCVC